MADVTRVDMFETACGIPVPAITAAEMREVDRIAIDQTGPNLYQMMENAGRSLATMATDLLGDAWSRSEILVLAGTGGNGGGGVCAARHLANRGAAVTLCLAAPLRLSSVTDAQYAIYRSTGGRETSSSDLPPSPALIVDALVGYSLNGAPRGVFEALIVWINQANARVLSLDIPSGVDATTGAAPGSAVRASVTLTLALPKVGLASDRAGRLWLADIGIPAETYRRAGITFSWPKVPEFVLPLKRTRESPADTPNPQ
jgi:NAD(P)H-hydrate epimerase